MSLRVWAHCRGATEALKMVSENFPWTPTSTFTYLQANHKSVLGMGTYAKRAGAKLKLVTEQDMQQWLDESQQSSHPVSSVADGFRSSSDSSSNGSHRLNGSSNGRHHLHGNDNSNGNGPSSGSSVTCHLVAYPLKDNYEGVTDGTGIDGLACTHCYPLECTIVCQAPSIICCSAQLVSQSVISPSLHGELSHYCCSVDSVSWWL